jgi:hypothetical protein
MSARCFYHDAGATMKGPRNRLLQDLRNKPLVIDRQADTVPETNFPLLRFAIF